MCLQVEAMSRVHELFPNMVKTTTVEVAAIHVQVEDEPTSVDDEVSLHISRRWSCRR